MRADQIERAAYIAAHAILATNLTAPELACPGARRSFAVDTIAEVIRGVLEAQPVQSEAAVAWRNGRENTPQTTLGPVRARKVLQVRADPSVRLTPVASLRVNGE